MVADVVWSYRCISGNNDTYSKIHSPTLKLFSREVERIVTGSVKSSRKLEEYLGGLKLVYSYYTLIEINLCCCRCNYSICTILILEAREREGRGVKIM